MEHLIFICPRTGHQIDSGVESDIGTLLRIREQTVRVRCGVCSECHEWRVRDAFLARAA
jgi:transcription elongation factor Elf1